MTDSKFDLEEAEPVGSGSYVVSQGECMYSIAARTGHAWTTLWEHPENAALNRAWKDPGILRSGDRVHIPEIQPKTLELPTGRRHRIVVLGRYVPLRLRMCDAEGEPIANAKFVLDVEGRRKAVVTNGSGCFETKVPVAAQNAELTNVVTGETYFLKLGHMDPPRSSSAVRKSLANLGYNVEADDAPLDEHALGVVGAFREDASISAGAAAEDILEKLREEDPWQP